MANAGLWESVNPPILPEIISIIHQKFGFKTMTPVQAATLPKFLENKDVAVEAPTGSGKTLAFVIPMMQRLLKRQRNEDEGPLQNNEVGAIIITPTRELAEQIYEVTKQFTTELHFSLLLLIGGRDIAEDVKRFREGGGNVLVGTPGRLDEFIKRVSDLQLKTLEILILDEADRLLDMGFHMTLLNILSKLPKQRRTGLFSATQTREVTELMTAGLRNPVKIVVRVEEKSTHTLQTIPSTLKNYYMEVDAEEKISQFVHFLKNQTEDKKVIVFLLTSHCVDFFWKVLTNLEMLKGRIFLSLHGKVPQEKRAKIYRKFLELKSGVLLSTDVAARGLDFPDVDWIVQMDPPQDPSFFVHRVGRTARMGREGQALLFLNPDHELTYLELLKVRQVPIVKMERSEAVTNVLPLIKQMIFQSRELLEKSISAFVSYIRAYKQHHCNFIFRFEDLDLAKVANSFALLRMPKLRELQSIPPGFKEISLEEFNAIPYKDKQREKIRQEKLKKSQENNSQQSKNEKKNSRKRKRNDNSQQQFKVAKHQNLSNNTKKERHKQSHNVDLEDDLEELNRDYQLLKKRKRGKITEEEFEKQMGLHSLSEDDNTSFSIVDSANEEPTLQSENCQDLNMSNLIETIPDSSSSVTTANNTNDKDNNNNTSFNAKKKKHRKNKKKKKKPILVQ